MNESACTGLWQCATCRDPCHDRSLPRVYMHVQFVRGCGGSESAVAALLLGSTGWIHAFAVELARQLPSFLSW